MLLHQSPAVVLEAEVISSSEVPQEHLQAVRLSWVNCWHALFLLVYISHHSVSWFVYQSDKSSGAMDRNHCFFLSALGPATLLLQF